MGMKSIIAIVATVFLAACQTYKPVVHNTPSGRPEAIFSTLTPEETKQLLINTNINRGFILVESSDNVLEFKKPPERQRLSFYFSEFPIARYSNIRVIYNIFEAEISSDGGTRAVASVWLVGSPGTINEYKVGINDAPISLEVQQFLNELARSADRGGAPKGGEHPYNQGQMPADR